MTLTAVDVAKLRELRQKELSYGKIAKETKNSVTTVRKYLMQTTQQAEESKEILSLEERFAKLSKDFSAIRNAILCSGIEVDCPVCSKSVMKYREDDDVYFFCPVCEYKIELVEY